MNIQDLSFRIDWLDLHEIQGILQSLQNHSSKASILWCSTFIIIQVSHPYMIIGKTITLTIWTFVGKVISLPLARFAIAFLPRNKLPLISWLQSPSAVILELKKIKPFTVFYCFPTYLPWTDVTGCHDYSFLNVEFKPAFSLSSFTFINSFLVPLCFLSYEWYHLHIWDYLYFSQQSWFQLALWAWFQPGISHDLLCINLNKQADKI